MKLLLTCLLTFSFHALADDSSALSHGGKKEGYTGKGMGVSSSVMPEEIQNVGIDEKVGQKLDLTAQVKNEEGQLVPLSSFLRPGRPMIISPVYYNCPGLCNYHLNGLTETLKDVDWSPGNQFDVVAFSFDSKETPEVAAKKKANYLKLYGRSGTEKGWHFVTADEATIAKVTGELGFKFKWNEKMNEWAHGSAAILISPDGTISHYLKGIQFEPRDVKLALNEAGHGKVGNIVDSVLLYCFKKNDSGYSLQYFRVMQLGAGLSAVILAAWLIPFLVRAKRENS